MLYESYGFSVATLYCLGFGTGGVLSVVTGPLVDQIGRKKAALLYCALEIFINLLEQYPFYYGLVASRMIGGFTTNLLSTVFETWLDTEHRRRGLCREKYETILRESHIVSNMAAIASGFLAEALAERFGPVGPFRGAVTCTAVALVVVAFAWSENYGHSSNLTDEQQSETQKPSSRRTGIVRALWETIALLWNAPIMQFLREAASAYWHDSHMARVGISQGLSAGSLQIFVFLWAPMLRDFATSAKFGGWFLDYQGEPAYGTIFGAYMSCGVLGGFISPSIRRWVTAMVTPVNANAGCVKTIEVDGEGMVPVRPMAVEVLAATCYLMSAMMLFVPYFASEACPYSFSVSLVAFLAYELMLGVFVPCEGVIRSLYFPANARASVMAWPRIIVNFAVAIGVASTNYVRYVHANWSISSCPSAHQRFTHLPCLFVAASRQLLGSLDA